MHPVYFFGDGMPGCDDCATVTGKVGQQCTMNCSGRGAAQTPPELPDASRIDGWSVTVSVNAVDVLTIGHNSLSGCENIADFAPVVRTAAMHLLSFIGAGEDIVGNHIAASAQRGDTA
ncbi:hypothetical protein PPGU19_011510 [Paraburkholderia sp. PGU19]|uniref:hypothetical protein n=1 Tax=Paraburkholderia sp. PGU19 TaxID=2735434 RepID=UPI0015DA8741|nr:hypothetical protein [Paraburkholderia sp. PGU19]BCF96582.1 hypothetical protein PPGU19_011510 [Paraburkholderia sp. PGU19]